MKANLFIVGSMKAATTQYYNTLAQSEFISGGEIKEPNYFARNYIDLQKFNPIFVPHKHGIGSGNSHIGYLRNEREYEENFRNIDSAMKYIIDSSVVYAEFSGIEREIYNYNSQAKIIFCIRNPIMRAYSHYSMDKEIGRVKGSFLEEFYKDYNNNNKEWGVNSFYYECSNYHDKLNRYIKKFGEKNVCVLLTDIDSTIENCGLLSTFLGTTVASPKQRKSNASVAPRFSKVNAFLQSVGLKDLIKIYMPDSVKSRLKKLFYKPSGKITKEEMLKVRGLFYEDITKLECLINRKLKAPWGLDD